MLITMTYMQKRRPELVGSLVLSPQEIYSKLKLYKQKLVDDAGKL